MIDPAKMQNKAAVLDALCAAQLHFGEEPLHYPKSVTRPTLESFLLIYVKRFRDVVPVADTKNAFTTLDCPACSGSGVYAPNGGSCFRCKGKGFQEETDQKRNYGYDLHHRPTTAAAVAKAIDGEVVTLPQPTELEKAQDEVTQRLTGKSELYDEDDIPF